MAPTARDKYQEEVEEWVSNGWLIPYNEEEHGPVRGTVPLMAVVQPNKEKVRPVMDFRELNEYVTTHTADADVCAHKLREWRRKGTNVALIDLQKAYLQIHVHRSLWTYQTVVFGGKRYCLTRLGFGLKSAPQILKRVVATVLNHDEKIRDATSPYMDDIFVDESVVSAERVEDHLRQYGLECKPAERVSGNGARVLGLRVREEGERLRWERDNEMGQIPQRPTRRSVFSLCGRLVSHLPVCGWLRVAASFVKRRANAVTAAWDDPVEDPQVLEMMSEMVSRVRESDPARGRWDVSGDAATLWVDASSVALGAVLEVNGDVIEDASWLRKDDCGHINLAELEAVLKGLNLAVAWDMKDIRLMTDSQTVFHWLSDALSGKARIKTKAASELLIRRRLQTITSIAEEYDLRIDVHFVPSAENKADSLTRVPNRWLKRKEVGDPVCAAAGELTSAEVTRIHEIVGHPGIRRTLYFCRRKSPTVSRKMVQGVVRRCIKCQSIDPAPATWPRGKLSVETVWFRVGVDVTHVQGSHYLSMIDCGPSRFAIWKRLIRQDARSMIQQLELVFLERGAPKELLIDNYPAFRASAFCEFAERWGIKIIFRCAHSPSGNGITERCHRTVKTIVARSGCSVMEAVNLYNITPKDDVDAGSAPANMVYSYEVRVRGIGGDDEQSPGQVISCRFSIGDRVWIKDPSRRCDVPSAKGTVTQVLSAQSVEVDGIPRHVRDLRHVTDQGPDRAAAPAPHSDRDDEPLLISVQQRRRALGGAEDDSEPQHGHVRDADGPDETEVEEDSFAQNEDAQADRDGGLTFLAVIEMSRGSKIMTINSKIKAGDPNGRGLKSAAPTRWNSVNTTLE
ncbi:uncharacterized protein LOC122378020 [Amphibalanus amphitrite]|uniref:uncharacterized protein LOC122378020 n=1 Tax=Amphibalanus amphitrite TaxID=1232801 RepID=UPI001C904453|nr:uncharacterized protein LOC122378020 [Amphibalanus amphitrite]